MVDAEANDHDQGFAGVESRGLWADLHDRNAIGGLKILKTYICVATTWGEGVGFQLSNGELAHHYTSAGGGLGWFRGCWLAPSL